MARIGLIADIHGNADALRLVLAELASAAVDRIVCLGDVAVLGPEPGAAIDLLVDARCALVRGNTDAWLLDEPSEAIPPSPGASASLLDWTKQMISEHHLDVLCSAPRSLRVPLDDGSELLCAHGSPASFEHVIGPATVESEFFEMMRGETADLVAGGHTHLQTVRPFGPNTFINPGSVGLPGVGPGSPGLPVNRNVRWAEFAILEADEHGRRIDFRRIPLDIGQMWKTARDAGMPHADWWRSQWG